MSATMTQNEPRTKVPGMGRPKKQPTKTIRVFDETADELHRLAGVFGVDVATFAEDALRALIEKKRHEASAIILGKKKPPHKSDTDT